MWRAKGKIASVNNLETIFITAGIALLLSFGYLAGYHRGLKKLENSISEVEMLSLSSLLESLVRFVSFSDQGNEYYLDGLLRIWKTHIQTVNQEWVADLKQGRIIYVDPINQDPGWAYHLLVPLQDQNFIWLDRSTTLMNHYQIPDSSPLAFAIQDGEITRLVILFFPKVTDQKQHLLSGYFRNLDEVISKIRANTLSSKFHERLANELHKSNIKMKQLFSNVKHNIGNALSGLMGGLGLVEVCLEEKEIDHHLLTNLLQNHVLPNFAISHEMVSQMYDSINAVIEDQSHYQIKSYAMKILFNRFFAVWLSAHNQQNSSGVVVKWDIPEDVVIKTSDLVFFQVVWNVIKNAIKYTESGSIDITTFTGTDDRVYLKVKDTGPGIPEKHQENIGSYGFRSDQTQLVDGEGIGLWGAYQLISAVNGYLYFDSKVGIGTEFNIGFIADIQ